MVTSTALLNAATSKSPLLFTNFIRFRDARLQAVSSRNIYSEQGLLALMRAVFLQVCQLLMVVSYCMPGSPQCQVESAILYIVSRAFSFSLGWPSRTALVQKSLSSSYARMKSSFTRTEWLAFWKKIEL